MHLRISIALLAGLWLCGCAPDVGRTPEPAAPRAAMPLTARSVQDRLIRCHAFGAGRPTVLIIGGIHGAEPAGAALAKALSARLESSPSLVIGRRVLVVETANPDGLAMRCRTNARGVDINRNFPTENWAPGPDHGAIPLSEPETAFLAGLISRQKPACIVQIHQPLACVDWDGPARELAAAMSEAAGLRAKKLGARPGSLGSYAGIEHGIPTVTLELPRSASRMSRDALWGRYGRALLVAIESVPADAGPRVRFGGSIEYSVHHTRSP